MHYFPCHPQRVGLAPKDRWVGQLHAFAAWPGPSAVLFLRTLDEHVRRFVGADGESLGK
jgi:hypothetical protein